MSKGRDILIDESRSDYRLETIKITLPVFLELLISSLFGMVDMMMIGKSGTPAITTPSIAAIGITNQMMFIGISLIQALATGGTTMIARYTGAKENEKISPVLKHLIIISFFILVLPFMLITQFNGQGVMRLIGAQEDAISIGFGYFKIVTIGFFFQAFNLTVFSAMRGMGDTKNPMKINLSVNFLNVIGNYLLIFGKFGLPRLGVTGAGISTTISQITATIVLIIYLVKGNHDLKLKLKEKFLLDGGIIKNLINIGGPAALEQVIFRVGILLFVRIVSQLGTVVYATHQIALNILSLSYAPGQAFGIATTTLVGRSLGERRIDKAEEYIKESNVLSLVVSAALFLVFFFLGTKITGLYTEDQNIITQSKDVLKLMAFIQPFQAVTFVMSGGLRGAGDTISTLVVTLVSAVVVRLASAYILVNVLHMGLMGAWIALFIDQMTRFIGITWRFKLGNWKYIKLY